MRVIPVTAAIIKNTQDKYLIAQRKAGKDLEFMWEFPGGKIEPNETPEECLERELREEFSIESKVGKFFAKNDHLASSMKTISLMAYDVEYISGEFQLHDHIQIKWIELNEMTKYEFAPADIPIVNKLVKDRNL